MSSTNRIYFQQVLLLYIFLYSAQLLYGEERNDYSISQENIISLDGKWKIMPAGLVGGNVYSRYFDDKEFQEIKVPSNWYLQGFDLENYVWYRKEFTIEKKNQNEIYTLLFSGVDYHASVWLNGQYLGSHEGYFQKFSFDISNNILDNKPNLLAVLVNSPFENPNKNWSLQKRVIKGIFSHHDTRPGGAWSARGQEKNTGGIWGSVSIKVNSGFSIDKIETVASVDVIHKQGKVDISSSINSAIQTDQFVIVKYKLEPYNFKGKTIISKNQEQQFHRGLNKLYCELEVNNVKLWHSWDYGTPYLYELDIQISHSEIIVARKKRIIGFRNIDYNSVNNSWELNGKRIFLRGTNYISSQWLSEMTEEKYTHDILLMKKANLNAVRVHAHIEDHKFYALCDKMGILVWQDFPLQWGYANDDNFIDEAKSQLADMIDQYNNHASIITWCLHNEPPWDSKWMQHKYTDYDKYQNIKLDNELFRLAKKLDTSRHIFNISDTESHLWKGWYYGEISDFDRLPTSSQITEFGAQALPNLESLRKIFDESALFPDSKQDWKMWEYHNFQQRENFKLAKISKGKNINEFISNSQAYQSKLTKFAIESLRQHRYKPVASLFQFMFTDNWPSITWSVLDYWRNPKPAFFKMSQSFQALVPIAKYKLKKNKLKLSILIINDLWTDFDNTVLEYTVSGTDQILDQGHIAIDIKPDSMKKIIELDLKYKKHKHLSIVLKILDKNNKLLSLNNYEIDI